MKTKRKIRLKKNIIYIIMFCLGLVFLIYPFISQIYYRYGVDTITQQFDNTAKKISQKELKERLDLARAYNETLNPEKLSDPYSEEEKRGIAEYARMLEVHEMIGYIEIPQIGEKLPIYAGTSEEVLQKGAGHLEGSSLPIGGVNTHSVITAHRGLSKAKLFRNLDELKVGDVFFVHNIEKVLAYEVDQILTVEPTNFNPVLVEKDKDYCTLLTCTPYVINSHRLLVRGHRVDYIDKKDIKNNRNFFDKESLLVLLLCAIILVIVIRYYVKKRRKTCE